MRLIALCLMLIGGWALGTNVDFKADFYERSLESDTVHGKGHASIHTEDRDVWADEIEIDFKLNRALAVGHVTIKDSDSEISAVRVSYSLDGAETILDDAVLVARQMVITGASLIKRGKKNYEIEEGSYTNCNLDNLPPEEAKTCRYHWKVYGRKFTVEVGRYAHISDALVMVEDLPIAYTPYLIVPVKSERESGLLLPTFSNHTTKGSGFSLPYYWAIAEWQDLEFNPSFYSKTGYDLGLTYRYSYSKESLGFLRYNVLQRQFGGSPLQQYDIRGGNQALGFIGESSVYTHHAVQLSNADRILAEMRRVSNPIYTVDYAGNIDSSADLASLRSQVTYSHSGETSYFGAGVIDHQSMVVSRDSGIDGGGVTQLPLLLFSRPSRGFLGDWLSFEFDTEWANFYRPGLGYDQVPAIINPEGPNADPNPNFHSGNYIRTGQRLFAEPRLVANVPMPPGFQFQPILKGGTLGYLFSIPEPQSLFRFYTNIEIPISLYLSKVYRDSAGTPVLSHVIQPRIVYAKNLFRSLNPNAPFFSLPASHSFASAVPTDALTPMNPTFDARDLLSRFEYVRFELINRFRKRTGPGQSSRVFAFQVAEQINIRSQQLESDKHEANDPTFDPTAFANDPRYAKSLGPIEALAEFSLGRFTGQLQANYQLSPVKKVAPAAPDDQSPFYESDFSGGIEYRAERDFIALSTRLQNRADWNQTEQTARFSFAKSLPPLPDIEGDIEYSPKVGKLIRYGLAATFASRPASCWSITARVGEDNMQNSSLRTFTYSVSFRFDFGSPGHMLPTI
ncbi:MAG: LPS-assembly protein LptD [Deltaproteobacteria bacterium]|nr:LPS-assembly protein LptD [Deltaproteobacteria bacterium]MBI3296025.1 LPS-assembly protein LptD [Deltaproteobacteria bacterium]